MAGKESIRKMRFFCAHLDVYHWRNLWWNWGLCGARAYALFYRILSDFNSTGHYGDSYGNRFIYRSQNRAMFTI